MDESSIMQSDYEKLLSKANVLNRNFKRLKARGGGVKTQEYDKILKSFSKHSCECPRKVVNNRIYKQCSC